jgi:hypothetical protein
MTTYDEIFESFLNNCGVDTSRLPTNESIYQMIENAINHYNVFLKDETPIICDDNTETINVKLDGARLLILAYCLKYVYLENELVGFQELWSPFQKEVGIKDYRGQVSGRENTLKRTTDKIIELVSSIEDKSIM